MSHDVSGGDVWRMCAGLGCLSLLHHVNAIVCGMPGGLLNVDNKSERNPHSTESDFLTPVCGQPRWPEPRKLGQLLGSSQN